MTKSDKLLLLALTIITILVFFFLTAQPDSDEYSTRDMYKQDSLQFNSAAWEKSLDHVDAVRPYMLADLRKNILKVGMTRSDIEALLGKTLPWDNEGERLYYRIGILGGMEPTYLVIELDENATFKTSALHDY